MVKKKITKKKTSKKVKAYTLGERYVFILMSGCFIGDLVGVFSDEYVIKNVGYYDFKMAEGNLFLGDYILPCFDQNDIQNQLESIILKEAVTAIFTAKSVAASYSEIDLSGDPV